MAAALLRLVAISNGSIEKPAYPSLDLDQGAADAGEISAAECLLVGRKGPSAGYDDHAESADGYRVVYLEDLSEPPPPAERICRALTDGFDQVHAMRQYFMDQRQGDELIGYPNTIAADSMLMSDRVIGPVGTDRRFLHEAVIRTTAEPRVVWYWYRVAGFDTPFESKAKLLEILAFFKRSAAAELVTLSAVCSPDDCRDAGNVLRRAMGAPSLPPQEPPSEGSVGGG